MQAPEHKVFFLTHEEPISGGVQSIFPRYCTPCNAILPHVLGEQKSVTPKWRGLAWKVPTVRCCGSQTLQALALFQGSHADLCRYLSLQGGRVASKLFLELKSRLFSCYRIANSSIPVPPQVWPSLCLWTWHFLDLLHSGRLCLALKQPFVVAVLTWALQHFSSFSTQEKKSKRCPSGHHTRPCSQHFSVLKSIPPVMHRREHQPLLKGTPYHHKRVPGEKKQQPSRRSWWHKHAKPVSFIPLSTNLAPSHGFFRQYLSN